MLKFDQVLHARLGSLEKAVTDWGQTHDKLAKLEEKAENGLRRKADKADWAGQNAGVTRPFVKKTAKEFADAAKVADSIRNILKDALSEFKAAKKTLEKLIDEAPARGIRIGPNGAVSYLVHPDRRSKDYDGPKPEQADFDAMRSAIKAAIDRANDADDVASRAMRTVVGTDENNFSGTDYDSLKDASRAQDAEDAKLAAEIVKKGDEASPKEIDRLNKYIRDNQGDRYFAERFALEVGAKGTLEYWADLGDTGDGSRLGLDHPDKLKELQKNWSLTLAAATHSTSPEMEAWKSDLIKAGDDPIRTPRGASPYGFQVMSNLMRFGNYEKGFLNDYGNSLVATERKMTRDGMVSPGHVWLSSGSTAHLNWSGTDLGRDPMVGFMESLGRNPSASKEFFKSEFDLPLGSGDDEKGKKLNAFDYFTKGREWPEDIVEGGNSNKYGYDSVGHALEAATLGSVYDDLNATLRRDNDTAEIMKKVVELYGNDPGLLKKQESLADSLGRMGAGYIDDINWALNDNDGTSMFAPAKGKDGDFEAGHAEFGMDGAQKFLSAVGKHPDGYAEIANAEKVYTMSMLEAQVGSDGKINESFAREAVRTGGEVQGMIDQARADQVKAEGLKADEEYNKALEERSKWVGFGAGVVVAGGAAFLPPVAAVGVAATLIPVAQDAGSGVLTELINGTIGDFTESKQQDSGEDVQKQLNAIFDAGRSTASSPMEIFRSQHDIGRDSDFGQDLEEALKGGYATGNDYEGQHGSLPQTD